MEEQIEYVVGKASDLEGRQGHPLDRQSGRAAGSRLTVVRPQERVVTPAPPPAAQLRECGVIPVLDSVEPGRFEVHTYQRALIATFDSDEAMRDAQRSGFVRLTLGEGGAG